MAVMIVFAFDTEDGAGEMRDALNKMQKQQLIELEDAAVVVRRQDGKVKVKQAVSLVGAGALRLSPTRDPGAGRSPRTPWTTESWSGTLVPCEASPSP